MEKAGQIHNQGLKIVLSNFGDIPNTNAGIREKTVQLIRTNSDLQALFSQDLSNANFDFDFPEVNAAGELDLEQWVNEMDISDQLKVAVLETFTILETSATLDKIVKDVKEKEKNAANRFNGAELDTYYSHLAVAKYSAAFWSPESEGGENGIKYLDLDDGVAYEVNWGYVYAMDCAGTVIGGTSIAITMSATTLLEELKN
jgi:hypothetical protein